MSNDLQVTEVVNITSTVKDNGNVVLGVKGQEKFTYLPFNKKDKYFMNPQDFVKFISAVEKTIRTSDEYARYIAWLKNDVGLRRCMMFPNITDADVPIEMHHGPIFNLYDIVEIQIAYMFKNGDNNINSMRVAHHVMEDHFNNIIQVVMLCEMAHKGWHAFQKLKVKEGKFFMDMRSAWGDLGKFIDKYKDALTIQHINKVKNYLLDFEKYAKETPETPSMFNYETTDWADKFSDLFGGTNESRNSTSG